MSEASGKPRIALVCQRYGSEVNGGSEQYCRQLAERLAELWDVTVYTTCALDYLTWANYYSPGEEYVNGVRVKRYLNSARRNKWLFRWTSGTVLKNPWHTDAGESRWIDRQGPFCPDLIEALHQESGHYRAVLFMTYLYYTTVRGMALSLDNAILIPTVHDEPPVYLKCFDAVFAGARGIAWNTPEERDFALKRFPFVGSTPSVMTGIGVDLPTNKPAPLPEALAGARYLVYAGRIDRNKGCGEMFDFFLRFKQERGGDLKLALIGKTSMEIPDDADIVRLGYVSEETKYSVMANAVALTLFSRFESLSMVSLESMALGRPILVTGHSEVLKGHCIRSEGGVYFDDYEGFARSLDQLLAGGKDYETMCAKARHYVEETYQWDVIVGKYKALIDEISEETTL